MQLLASLTRCLQFALSLAILIISLGFLRSDYLFSPYLEVTTGAFGIFTTAVGALLICMHDLPRQIAWTLDILASLVFLICGIFYAIYTRANRANLSNFHLNMRKACIVVSFAGFAAYTVSIVHSCLVNRRRKAPEVLEEDSGSSDNHARTEPLGHLHDKAELPSDSVARIYELHGHNVVEVGGRVLVTHELHSTPLAELPGDSKC